ncbi:MAG: RdgB/HAM1 family non-canonical purine NTP pyrophosphatase [Bacteroidota bacterium]|nr:RdgB/HAM1 family non-canonical purine NTP pyrophosphatase [Bacteroidota bacterium]
MRTLVFATNNLNKVIELRSILKGKYKILSLSEAEIDIDIPEPHATLEKNAIEKSSVIYQLTHKSCFAEDSGLEVKALNGEPGVKSARYAGEQKSDEDNIDKLLLNLKNKEDKSATFKTVISLTIKGNHFIFEGVCKGSIVDNRRGIKGFGYDPIFIPDGTANTFGEMTLDEKNKYSHRKKAVEKLIEFLERTEDPTSGL